MLCENGLKVIFPPLNRGHNPSDAYRNYVEMQTCDNLENTSRSLNARIYEISIGV